LPLSYMLAPESFQTQSQVKEHITLVSYYLFHTHILVCAGTVLTGRIIHINVAIINYYSAIIAF